MARQKGRRLMRLVPCAISFCAIALVSGCDANAPPAPASHSPHAPGVDRRKEAVSGLEVGHRLMAAREYDLALDAFTRAYLEEGPKAEVFSSLGSANLSLGRLGQAEQLLRRAVDMEPEWPEALNNLGLALLQQGKAAEAEQYLRRAYALNNGESDAMRDNLRHALEMLENSDHTEPDGAAHLLVRQGGGVYRIQSATVDGAPEVEQQP